jgi:FkbH-like protein
MIRGQIQRETARAAVSREEFLMSLDCAVTLVEIDSINRPEAPRALELINKTNQFNTNGQRWGAAATVRFFEEGGRVFAFFVKDRFVAYGLVGAIMVRGAEIAQIVMSCRVLGLGAEIAALRAVIEKIRERDPGARIVGRIAQTEANTPCRETFRAAGFSPTAADPLLFELGPQKAPVDAAHVTTDWK